MKSTLENTPNTTGTYLSAFVSICIISHIKHPGNKENRINKTAEESGIIKGKNGWCDGESRNETNVREKENNSISNGIRQ